MAKRGVIIGWTSGGKDSKEVEWKSVEEVAEVEVEEWEGEGYVEK